MADVNICHFDNKSKGRNMQTYTLETLPDLPSGRHAVKLNGVDLTLFSNGGSIYISMQDGARLVGLTFSAYRRRVIKTEEREGRPKGDLRDDFGGLEKWMKIKDVERIFFTPRSAYKPIVEKQPTSEQQQ